MLPRAPTHPDRSPEEPAATTTAAPGTRTTRATTVATDEQEGAPRTTPPPTRPSRHHRHRRNAPLRRATLMPPMCGIFFVAISGLLETVIQYLLSLTRRTRHRLLGR